MTKEIRVAQLYSELTKSLKYSFMSHSIILNLYSKTSTICAYNGLHHTITSIIKAIEHQLYDISLKNYVLDDNKQEFIIFRTALNVTYIIKLTAYKIDKNNQIFLQFIIRKM